MRTLISHLILVDRQTFYEEDKSREIGMNVTKRKILREKETNKATLEALFEVPKQKLRTKQTLSYSFSLCFVSINYGSRFVDTIWRSIFFPSIYITGIIRPQ